MANEHRHFNGIYFLSFCLVNVCVAKLCEMNFENRMLGGHVVLKGDWPFIVALFYVKTMTYFCGGTLISNTYVLTAAHCMRSMGSSDNLISTDVVVRLGAYNITVNNEEDAVDRNVTDIYVHPEWKVYGDQYDADLAILLLSEEVLFTNYIQPVSLPDDDAYVVGAVINITGTIVGWGLGKNRKHEEIPRQAAIKSINDTHCYRGQPDIITLSSLRTFCGGDGEGIPNEGDSGGGFFVNISCKWVQYGVISAISTDGTGVVSWNTLYAVYSNVHLLKKWILETIDGKITLICSYKSFYEDDYECRLEDLDLRSRNREISSFVGPHHPGKIDQDVNKIEMKKGTLFFLPNGIGKRFENLKDFTIGKKLGTKLIERTNLKNLEYLKQFNVYQNDITILDEDVLWDLPALEIFQLVENKLKVLHEKTFDKSSKLKEVLLSSNKLEALPRNLFKNRNLLVRVDFRNNLLKFIEVDFSELRSLKHFLFDKNYCINEGYNKVNKTIFQSHIRANCTKQTDSNFI